MINLDTKLKASLVSLLQVLILGILFSSMLFARSLMGVSIFGFRVGEYLTLIGFVLSILFLLAPKKYLKEFYFNDLQLYSHKLIIISFFIIGIINNANFLGTYTYKSSSYIWTIGFIFFGHLGTISSRIDIKKLFTIFLIVPIFNYLFSSGNYPNVFIDFFNVYSDKFQFLKASDIFLGYVATNFLMKYFIKSQNRRFLYFMITSSLLLPLLLYSSRGSFLGLVIYMFFEIIYSRKYILNNRIRVGIYFLISLVFFSFSILRIDRSELARSSVVELIEVYNEEGGLEGLSNDLFNLAREKETVKVIFSFIGIMGGLNQLTQPQIGD